MPGALDKRKRQASTGRRPQDVSALSRPAVAPTRRANRVDRPALPLEAIERHRLIARIAAHEGPTLLVAPPGYGKSTVLRQWVVRSGRPYAWLSLEAGITDVAPMWSKIIAALGESDAAVELTIPEPGATVRDVVELVVPRLANELEAFGDPIALVLDACDAVATPGWQMSMAAFLAAAPHNVRLALSGRTDHLVPLGERRTAGDVLELRAADLRFDDDETAAFLHQAVPALSADGIAAVQARTEGWPAAVYLAHLAILEAPDREAAGAAIHGSHRYLADYLSEVVLDDIDEPSCEVLFRTSIADRLSGPLCDAVSGAEASYHLLDQLAGRDLLLAPLDDQHEWYRWHPLVRDLLRAELQRRWPADLSLLHHRAYEWFSHQGLIGEAIVHAVEAGNVAAAASLVVEHYQPTLATGRYAAVAGWLEALPRELVDHDAELSIAEAWVMNFLLRPDEADLALQHALEADHDGPMADGTSSLEASAALLRAAFPRGDVGSMLRAARRAFELEADRMSPWQPVVHVLLGSALALAGRTDEARTTLERATALVSLERLRFAELVTHSHLAGLALEAGDLDAAERHARVSLDNTKALGLETTWLGAYPMVTLGAVLVRRHDAAAADQLVRTAVDLLSPGVEPLLLLMARLTLIRVQRELGAIDDATETFDRAQALLATCADAGVLHRQLEALGAEGDRGVAKYGLTPREVEIIGLLCAGLTQREIGRKAYLSYNTVHSHVRSIYHKLAVGSRLELVDVAHRAGLVDGEDHWPPSPSAAASSA